MYELKRYRNAGVIFYHATTLDLSLYWRAVAPYVEGKSHFPRSCKLHDKDWLSEVRSHQFGGVYWTGD